MCPKNFLAFSLALASLTGVQLVSSPQDEARSGETPTHRLAWLEGDWVGEGFGGLVEEAWLAPRDGVMLGVFRHHVGGKPKFFELMTITDHEGELTMGLKHFHANLASWEEKNESLVWPESDAGDDSIRFGPVLYERDGDDALNVWVEVGEGEPQLLVFKRAKLSGE